jgi:parallel beta-helix repeat protein
LSGKFVVSTIILFLLFWIAHANTAYSSESDSAIYIRADGSVFPSTAPLFSVDNITYVLTANVTDSIIAERNDILLDGANYTAFGWRIGIDLTGRTNVTIKNVKIETLYGILLENSDRNTIVGTTISAGAWGSCIILHSSYDNNITGNFLTLTRALDSRQPSIFLSSSASNTISQNIIAADLGTGIYLTESSANCILDNNITAATFGTCLELECSHSNSLLGNNMAGTNREGGWCGGIFLFRSFNNVLRNNNLVNFTNSFGLIGTNVTECVNDVDLSNILDGKPIYYWVNETDKQVPADGGCVVLVNCSNITVDNLTLVNNYQGLSLYYTNDSTIFGNLLKNNFSGVFLWQSSNNSIIENSIIRNDYGIYLQQGSDDNYMLGNDVVQSEYFAIFLEDSSGILFVGNTISGNGFGLNLKGSVAGSRFYRNNFLKNNVQVEPGWSINTWNDDYPFGGNYWSDYTGADIYSGQYQNETGFDWIGDLPYTIDIDNIDRYPLIQPFKVETEDLKLAYRSLLLNMNEVNSELELLNTKIDQLKGNFAQFEGNCSSLETTVSNLQERITSLNSTIDSLKISLDSTNTMLNDAISNLQSELSIANSTMDAYINSLRLQNNAISCQLNAILNILYVAIAVSVILVIVTIYVTLKRTKTRIRLDQYVEPDTKRAS